MTLEHWNVLLCFSDFPDSWLMENIVRRESRQYRGGFRFDSIGVLEASAGSFILISYWVTMLLRFVIRVSGGR